MTRPNTEKKTKLNAKLSTKLNIKTKSGWPRPMRLMALAFTLLGLLSPALPGGTLLAQSAAATPASASTSAPTSAPTPGQVNLNTASPEELQRLPGVGPARAEAIVAYRARRPFRRVEELMRISGIGRKTFQRLRPMLTLDGPTTLGSR